MRIFNWALRAFLKTNFNRRLSINLHCSAQVTEMLVTEYCNQVRYDLESRLSCVSCSCTTSPLTVAPDRRSPRSSATVGGAPAMPLSTVTSWSRWVEVEEICTQSSWRWECSEFFMTHLDSHPRTLGSVRNCFTHYFWIVLEGRDIMTLIKSIVGWRDFNPGLWVPTPRTLPFDQLG